MKGTMCGCASFFKSSINTMVTGALQIDDHICHLTEHTMVIFEEGDAEVVHTNLGLSVNLSTVILNNKV